MIVMRRCPGVWLSAASRGPGGAPMLYVSAAGCRVADDAPAAAGGSQESR